MKNDSYESARMKARKLAALALRGVGGEAEAAAEALRRHLQRWNLKLEDLQEQHEERWVDLGPCKASEFKDLRALALNCLAWLLHQPVRAVTRLEKAGKKGGRLKVSATVSLADEKEWKDCFAHYAPEYLKTRQKLRRMARLALDGFLAQHDLFPPTSDDELPEMSQERREALIAAMVASSGATWQRGPKLTDRPLLA